MKLASVHTFFSVSRFRFFNESVSRLRKTSGLLKDHLAFKKQTVLDARFPKHNIFHDAK